MKQDMKTLQERTVQQGRRRASITAPAGASSSLVLAGVVASVDAGSTYTLTVGDVTFTGVLPLLPGVSFSANDPVAVLFQSGEAQPSILATGGGLDPDGAVYIVTGQMGFTA